MSLSRQSIALILTTRNKETQHYIHQKHKRETEKTALANKNNLHTGLVWLLQIPTRKRSGRYSYNLGAHTGQFLIKHAWKNTIASHPNSPTWCSKNVHICCGPLSLQIYKASIKVSWADLLHSGMRVSFRFNPLLVVKLFWQMLM